ncbi:ferrous iron transport protein B [Stetteria hydrogenophila]
MERAVLKRIRVALIGNPNVGKTVIFNTLTGSRQHVGNWPGVTVERKEGRFTYRDALVEVVDLPGTYSLTPYSLEEKIARDYIVEEKPDVVVDIVDASNLERNLYLTVDLLEAGANVVIALNMMDEAEARGIEIDVERLSKLLGVPVVPMVAIRGVGFEELKRAVYEAASRGREGPAKLVDYGRAERLIAALEEEIARCPQLARYPRRWLAVKLLEGDEDVEEKVRKAGCEGVARRAEELRGELEDPETYFADKRYEFVRSIVEAVVTVRGRPLTYTEMLDKVVTHRVFGIPIFITIMWAVFEFAFRVSAPFSDLIQAFFDWLGGVVAGSVSNPYLASFLADGVIAGLGSVLAFVPPIFFLFLALSLLEDSGYLTRAAFVMDKIMYKAGLSGHSVIPLLIGFGCNVPAVMATRTIRDWRDRLITILVNPLMSCSARFTVYALFAGAFFPGMEGVVILSMYLLGIALAALVAFLLRRLLFGGEPSPLILEMPPYRMPTLRIAAMHMWERGEKFLRKAGTIILLVVVLVWLLSTLPGGPGAPLEETYVARLGHALEPLFKPMGWNWKAAVALFFGFLAKEAVVGTLGELYGIEGATEESPSLQAALHADFTPLTAYAYMAFVLIYVPCVATLAAIKQETGSWKWPLFTLAYLITLAYIVALAIVSLGHLLGYA